jgi:hypothetical protein
MALSDYLINIGGSANDNSGDPLRLAFTKVNGAMSELYASLGNSVVPSPSISDAGKVLVVNNSGNAYQLSNSAFGNANISVGDTPPGNPKANDLWFDDLGGRLYIYYNNAWVESSPPLQNYKLTVPRTALGSAGDTHGEWTADHNYYYYCTATYTGNADPIWRRVAFINDDTWSNP